MARSSYRPRELEWQVFLGTVAIRRGFLTPYQLRSDAWISPLHGVYADARLERDHELRCRAAALRLPPGAVIAGPSAAWLHGVEFAAEYDHDVHLIAPMGARLSAARGLRVHHTPLDRQEVTNRRGLLCTTALRTAWDLAVWEEMIRAVTLVDGLLAQGLITGAELDKLVAERHGVRGVVRVKRVAELVDGGSQSPPESQLRVRIVLAGLPRPVTQFAITLRSGVVLHPDLAWPDYRVAVEYDGAWHDGSDQFHRDRAAAQPAGRRRMDRAARDQSADVRAAQRDQGDQAGVALPRLAWLAASSWSTRLSPVRFVPLGCFDVG